MHEIETPNTNNTVSTTPPMNRAQRRAMATKRKRAQTKQNRMIANYIKRHPETIQFNIDEDKVAEIENKTEEENLMTSGFVQLESDKDNELEAVTTAVRGNRVSINPIDEKGNLSVEELQEVIEEVYDNSGVYKQVLNKE